MKNCKELTASNDTEIYVVMLIDLLYTISCLIVQCSYSH